MRVLIHVKRKNAYEIGIAEARFRHAAPYAYMPRELDLSNSNFVKEAEFFEIDESPDVDLLMRTLAEQNPGCEVRVFRLSAVSQCPAGPIVVKSVTADGILPT